jgi:hypothetical protein
MATAHRPMKKIFFHYKNFNRCLAKALGRVLSSMEFFYFCVLLDALELKPVIDAHNIITWCTYLSSVVIQLLALPLLGFLQNENSGQHEEAHKKLDAIMRHHGIKYGDKS